MPASSRISRDLDAAREAYDQVSTLLLLFCLVFTSLLQAEQSPDYAKRRSMEMHQLHSEPKESGHCDIDYCLDAALQGSKTLIFHDIALLCKLVSTIPQAWFMVLPTPAYLSHAWSDVACVLCHRHAPPEYVLSCSSMTHCVWMQGGRFILVSAAGLGLMRSCDLLTTSDLCV